MNSEIKNLQASVLARLKNLSRETNQTLNQLLIYFGLERFLYRLSKSEHRDKFVLKGALVMRTWPTGITRMTRDIDFRSYAEPNADSIIQLLKEVCVVPVEPDGIEFDTESIQAEAILEHRDFPGIRARLWAYIGKVEVRIRIDLGFSDSIVPPPVVTNFPTLLDMPAPHLPTYPKETIVAEKLEAIVQLGEINTRIRDFYDLWQIAYQFEFDGQLLCQAINQTFNTRRTEFPLDIPPGLNIKFARINQAAWETFLIRIGEEPAVASTFTSIIKYLQDFLIPPLYAARDGSTFLKTWSPIDKWVNNL